MQSEKGTFFIEMNKAQISGEKTTQTTEVVKFYQSWILLYLGKVVENCGSFV